MTFANPVYLWAFAGLAIPLGIHLLSRKEGKIVRVGSLRHVVESNTSQFKSIRLNEIFLLLLRCLMVAMIVLFMSGAQCNGRLNKSIRWVVAEQGLDADSLVAKGYEFHAMPQENYWGYVEDLNKLPYEIIVLSHSYVDNFRGKRIALNDNINWITMPANAKQYDALAWSAGDSIFVRRASSNGMVTPYNTRVGVPDSIEVIKPHEVALTTNDPIVIAALNTLKKEFRLPITFSGGQTITTTPSIGPLVERVSPTEIHINKTLDQDVALNNNLVIELFKVLYPELAKPEVDKDIRVLPDEIAFSKTNSISLGSTPSATGIEKYLVALFVLTLAAERFVAIRKNQ